jgi:gluconokinase
MVIIVMGVSGSGKTTIGRMLAETVHWQFSDADDFHSAANIEKMSLGMPLTDRDRLPWLQTLHQVISEWLKTNTNAILACSALKSEYRHLLQVTDDVKWVYLDGSFELIQQRIRERHGHPIKETLLQSQFDELEVPEEAIHVDISGTPEASVRQIRDNLSI